MTFYSSMLYKKRQIFYRDVAELVYTWTYYNIGNIQRENYYVSASPFLPTLFYLIPYISCGWERQTTRCTFEGRGRKGRPFPIKLWAYYARVLTQCGFVFKCKLSPVLA